MRLHNKKKVGVNNESIMAHLFEGQKQDRGDIEETIQKKRM
jgi:hypothetical protein